MIDVEFNEQGLLVCSDHFAPGWRAEVTSEGLTTSWRGELLRAHGVLRAIWLPPGRHRVVMTYRPPGFWLAALASLFAWLGVAAAFFLAIFRRRQSPALSEEGNHPSGEELDGSQEDLD